MIHIGNLIQKELRQQKRSFTWFAEQICCDRSNVYKIIQKKSIDTDLLQRISITLKKDFFQYYSEAFYE